MTKSFWIGTLAFAFMLAYASRGLAEEKWTEARAFLTANTLDPKPDALNAETSSSQIEALENVTGAGLEISTPLLSWVKVGLKGGGRWNKLTESGNTGADAAFLSVQQGYGGGLLRVYLLQTKLIRLDLFGEGGLTKTTIDIKTAAGAGTYRDEGTYGRAGLSFAIGWDKYFLFFEGGPEWNRASGFTKSGTTSANLNAVDFGGSYFAVGLLFNGIPGLIKTH